MHAVELNVAELCCKDKKLAVCSGDTNIKQQQHKLGKTKAVDTGSCGISSFNRVFLLSHTICLLLQKLFQL